MKNYQCIIFDADDTLFHFDAFNGLATMFATYGFDFTPHHFKEFELINKPLWDKYQNGEITVHELQKRRFASWSNHLNVSALELGNAFIETMAEISNPLDGAIDLLNTLKGKARLGIITNGFNKLQKRRMARTGLEDYFEVIVVSEEVGIPKPHKAIFDHTLAILGDPDRDQVLMVGDNPDSDILGGLNAGLHTCWLNAYKKSLPAHITPHYEITSLKELESLLSY